MSLLTNINCFASSISALWYPNANDNIYDVKNKYSNLIKIEKVKNLLANNIKQNKVLFKVVGTAEYFSRNAATYLGQMHINGVSNESTYNYYRITSWASQSSDLTEEQIFPSKLGCVFCPLNFSLGFFYLLGVYNSYLYYTYSNNKTFLYCNKIDDINTMWIKSLNITISPNLSYIDNGGIYIVEDNNRDTLIKYDLLNGNELWRYNIDSNNSIQGISGMKNNKIVLITDSESNNVTILNAINGVMIKQYTFLNDTPRFNVEYDNGYILLYSPLFYKENTNLLTILNENGNVLLNLSITSSSSLWNRIRGDAVWTMGINKNKELWVCNYINNENYWITKIAITTSNAIGAKIFEKEIFGDITNYDVLFYQDDRTGGMYAYSPRLAILQKYENITNKGTQLFSAKINNSGATNIFFDMNNKGTVYFEKNNAIFAIRDNSYGINYYKDVNMQ